MANGYTKYPHWLESRMMQSDLNGREFKILIAIIRQTFGYGKNYSDIAYTMLSKMTGIDRRHCIEVVKSLEQKKVIKIKRGRCGINSISLLWGSAENGTSASAESGKKRVPNSAPIKEKDKDMPTSYLALSEPILVGKKNDSYIYEDDFND